MNKNKNQPNNMTNKELENKIQELELELRMLKSRKTDDVLLDEEHFFYPIFQAIPISIAISNITDGIIVEANNSFLKLTERTRSEVIGKQAIAIGIDINTELHNKILAQIEQGQQVPDFEVEITTKTGEKKIGLVNAQRITIKNKQFVINSFVDITARKQSALNLNENEEKFKTIFEKSMTAMLIADDKGNYISVNNAAANLFGYSIAEFVQMNVGDLITTTTPNAALRYSEYIKNGQETGEFGFVTKNGVKKVSQYQAIRIKPDFNFSINFDITERKQDEQNLQILAEELRKLNADKDRFIAILAHDLKNPFNSLLGLSDMLLKNLYKYDVTKIEDQLKIIHYVTNTTYHLLEDLLLWSKAQSGKLTPEPQKIIFSNICQEIINNIKYQADKKEITINCFEPEKTILNADLNMLKTIIRNLISNAIKFTNKNGRISIYTEKTNKNVIITISDNGVGIEKNVQEKIWHFTQLTSTNGTANEKGTGLGLLLCKEFVEKHGGTIWVESEVGKGSEFKFTMPLYND